MTDYSPIGIAGAGRVAQALGKALRQKGFPIVCIASRTAVHAEEAAAFIGPDVQAVAYSGVGAVASRILIAVPDRAITEVSSQIASSGIHAGIALHTCGTCGPEALSELSKQGVSCGSLHPLQTVSSPQQGVNALSGCAFAIDGDEAAIDWATVIATRLGGAIIRVPQDKRPLYHAAAVMASNYVVGLIDAAQHLLEMAGVEKDAALRALAPLLRSSVESIVETGPALALTGPIERGDIGTVLTHTRALSAAPLEIQELYRTAGLQVLALARRRGLDAGAAKAIEEALRGE